MELHHPIYHRPGKETNLLLRIKQGSMRAEPMTQCLVSCHHHQQPHPVKLYSTALSFSTKICSLQYQDLLKKDRWERQWSRFSKFSDPRGLVEACSLSEKWSHLPHELLCYCLIISSLPDCQLQKSRAAPGQLITASPAPYKWIAERQQPQSARGL